MTTEPIPAPAVCPWPIDDTCLPPEWDTLDEPTKDRSIAFASATLHRLTGYRVGGCPVTVRPCRSSCTDTSVLPSYWYYGGHFLPHIAAGGVWVNSCGCTTDCSCEELCEVSLPPPVGEVQEVVVDGTLITDYVVSGNKVTWVGDGECPWPTCQDLTLPDTEVGTFSITYLNSWPVDGLGAYAAGILAGEFAKACTGTKCRLPANVTTVSRQGITYDVAAGTFPNGTTGIREVDAFIGMWNPSALRQQTRVWSPDLRTPRVVR
jgi:hypothetical protein